MIDDNVQARPQAGFNAASVVYQAPADGGEDRYMLVFQEGDAATVGPVRSGRPYFVRWASEFRSGVRHFGGDAKTLQQVIPAMDGSLIYDVDALTRAAGRSTDQDPRCATQRLHVDGVSPEGRRTPRCAGLDVDGLPRWTFMDDGPADARPGSGRSPSRTAGARRATLRSEGERLPPHCAGRAQTDQGDGKRVVARNIIVLFQRLSYDPDSEPGYRRPILDQTAPAKRSSFEMGHA